MEVWDAHTGRALFSLRGHNDQISGVAFTPDGTYIATASWDKTLRIWDAATGVEVRRFIHPDWIRGLAISPDGRRIILSGGSRLDQPRLRIVDLATGAELGSIRSSPVNPSGVAFSPDGKYLASAHADQTVRVWDASTGAPLLTCVGHTGPINSVAFSPDGRRLASGSIDKTIKIWDATTGMPMRTLEGHSHVITHLAFSPDGRRLASASLSAVKLWDVEGGELLSLKGQKQVAFSPDGQKLLTAGEGQAVRVWDGTPLAPSRPGERVATSAVGIPRASPAEGRR